MSQTTPKQLDLYILTQFASGKENSTSYLWALFIESAQKAGHNVHVISPRISKYSWMPKSAQKLVVTFVLFWMSLWRIPRNSIVICATNPVFLPLLMPALQRLKGIKTFFVVHDLFPQNALVAKLMTENSRAYRTLYHLFRRAYLKATGLIAIGRDMQTLLRTLVDHKTPVLYVPNWIPKAEKTTARYLPTTDICRFQYFGNLGPLQGVEVVLNGIALSTSQQARFEFVGSGNVETLIKAHPTLMNDKRIMFSPGVPFEDRDSVLDKCDVSLVTLRANTYGLAVPSKAYFSIAHIKPFLYVGDPDSELHLLIQEHPALGWFVPAGHAQALAEMIDRICTTQHHDQLDRQAHNVIEQICPDKALEKIVPFLECS